MGIPVIELNETQLENISNFIFLALAHPCDWSYNLEKQAYLENVN